MHEVIQAALTDYQAAVARNRAKNARKRQRQAEYESWSRRLRSLPVDEKGRVSATDFDAYMAERAVLDEKWAAIMAQPL